MTAPAALLDAARSGDAGAFEQLVAPHRAELRAYCYQMLGPLQSRWRFLPASANGQIAFGTYLREQDAGAYVPGGLDVLALRDGRVAEIVAFLDADLTRFGLPARIPG